MRTTVELPDELLTRVKIQTAIEGISLRQFLTSAVEEKLSLRRASVRRPPPVIKGLTGPKIGLLSSEEIDEAIFG